MRSGLRGPPGAVAQAVGDRWDQEGADEEGVEEDAYRDRGADLDQLLQRQQGEGGEGAGEDQSRAGDDAAGAGQRGEDALAGAADGGLLARSGHQEDVVIDPERDEEDEGHQLEVEGEPFHPEDVGEDEGGEAEGGGEGGDHGRDQVGGGHQGAQHRDQDQADDEQDQRHDQLRVPRVGLLDVEVLDRDPAEQAARGDGVQPFADLFDRGFGVAAVGILVEDEDEHRLRGVAGGRCRQHQLDRVELFHLPPRRRRLIGLDHRRQRRAQSGGEVPFQRFGAAARIGCTGHSLAEPERFVVGEVAQREDDEQS